jgi:hypothetical protein
MVSVGYSGMFIAHDGPPMNNHLLLVTEETESQSQGKSEGETQKERRRSRRKVRPLWGKFLPIKILKN